MHTRFLPSLVVLGSFLLIPSSMPAVEPTKVEANEIDARVAAAMKAFSVPGCAIGIVKDDKVIHLKGYGTKRIGEAEPVTEETLFAIASTSKAFTATALAMLVDDGKLNWDDPVRKHVDYFRLADPLASESATLRDLITHRTGLSRNDLLWFDSPWKREEIIRRVGHVKLTQPYRQMFQYQNIMYAVAGEAIKHASGQCWEEFTAKRIFEPLGMQGANCSAVDAEKAKDHSRPHVRKADEKVVALDRWRNLDNCGPAGAINASVKDMMPWIRFNLGDGTFDGKRLLSEKRLRELHSPQMVIDMEGPMGVPGFSKDANPDTNVMTYGLGWAIQDYRGEHLVGHGGAIDGFRSQVALLPKHRIGIVIFANLGRNPMPEALRNSLIDYLLGLEKKDWNGHFVDYAKKQEAKIQEACEKQDKERTPETRPSLKLGAYIGDYDDPGYGRVTITMADGSLQLKWSNFQTRLEHWHFDTFMVNDAAVDRFHPLFRQTAAFMLGPDGKLVKLQFLGQEFTRKGEGK